MRPRSWFALFLLVLLAAPALASPPPTEVWRSQFGEARAVSVDARDNSVWAVVGVAVLHIASDGTVKSRTPGFLWAQGIAANSADGSCWVADTLGNRVVHLDASGAVAWQEEGISQPVAVAVSPTDGSCWIAAVGQHYAGGDPATDVSAVIHLAADGSELARMSRLSNPFSVSVNPTDGSCWVTNADSAAPEVVHLAADGSELWSGQSFSLPLAAAVDTRDGSCWIADVYANQLIHLASSGEQIRQVSGYGGIETVSVNQSDGSCWIAYGAGYHGGKMAHLRADGTPLWQGDTAGNGNMAANAIAANPNDGSCWVADWQQSVLLHLGADGTELWRGQGFSHPRSVAVNARDGTLWVADPERKRLVHIGKSGEELSVTNQYYPVAVAVNPRDGSVWTADPGGECVIHFDPSGREIWRSAWINEPYAIALDPRDGSCWAGLGSGVYHFAADGRVLWQSASFFQPVSISVDPTDGSVWIADVMGFQADRAVHLSSAGTVLWASNDLPSPDREVFPTPYSVAVDPRDGSCRIGDYITGEVICVSREGNILWRTPGFGIVRNLAVDPADSTCWVVSSGSQFVLARLAASGTVLWRSTGLMPTSVAVDPSDGSCWVADGGNSQVAHLTVFRFADIPTSQWAGDAIYACFNAGLSAGYPDGTYHPAETVTRAQMAVYLARALAGGDAQVPSGPVQPSFPDVDTDHWAYTYIEYAKSKHIVAGYPDGTYQPGNAVTRDQMAVYISRSVVDPTGDEGLSSYTPPATPSFPDVATAFYAYKYIEYAKSKSIVTGYPDGTYQPGNAVTRDQMAVYIARAFGLLK